MKASSAASKKLLPTAIGPEQLPLLVKRPVAAQFALVHVRTLVRAEKEGKLTPIKRNAQSVAYNKWEFLRWYGLEEEWIAAMQQGKPPPLPCEPALRGRQLRTGRRQIERLGRPPVVTYSLYRLRAALGISQPDMAVLCQCSTAAIQSIEIGRLKLSPSLAYKIADRIGVDFYWLMNSAPDQPPVNRRGEPYRLEDLPAEQRAHLDEVLSLVVPETAAARWTALTPEQISKQFAADFGFDGHRYRAVLEFIRDAAAQ